MNLLFLLKPKANVCYLFNDFTVRQALGKMQSNRFSTVPVLDRDGHYYGTISEGDLLWTIVEDPEFTKRDWEKVSLMTININRNYKSININETEETMLKLSLEQNFIPVVDDRGYFIGIITRQDIIKEIIKEK